MYYEGQHFEKDYERAAKFLTATANAGIVDAQFMIGLMYSRGEGVERDFIEAYKWLKLADDRGHQKANDYTNLLSENMTPEEIAEAKKFAEEWLKKHSKAIK